jgi:hypothetical protein
MTIIELYTKVMQLTQQKLKLGMPGLLPVSCIQSRVNLFSEILGCGFSLIGCKDTDLNFFLHHLNLIEN